MKALASFPAASMHSPTTTRVLRVTILLAAALLALWFFPSVWYTRQDDHLGRYWLTERPNVPGWSVTEIPVSKAAETVLVADRLLNAEYTNAAGAIVRTFLAKRYKESQNEIGLFAHTPDRCWTEIGWTLKPIQPDVRVISLHGVTVQFERRLFSIGPQSELVYFAGLVGGQPLPYRLDHNLRVGMNLHVGTRHDKSGTTLRAGDRLFWSRIWEAFLARRLLQGPKQFLRVSTPVNESDIAKGDELLEEFLSQWLVAAPYDRELQDWQHSAQTMSTAGGKNQP